MLANGQLKPLQLFYKDGNNSHYTPTSNAWCWCIRPKAYATVKLLILLLLISKGRMIFILLSFEYFGHTKYSGAGDKENNNYWQLLKIKLGLNYGIHFHNYEFLSDHWATTIVLSIINYQSLHIQTIILGFS